MDITPYLGTIVTVIIAVGSVYAAISSRLAKLETLITELRRDVEKHNKVIERVYELEQSTAVHAQRIEASEARIKKLEGHHE